MMESAQQGSGSTAVLIAGPTASGKSALALRYAAEFGGVVVNADSMQVYRGVPILTAQPSEADKAHAPHRLYGHVDPKADYSVGAWLREVRPLLAELAASGRVPIVVGGTGLYFRALLGGLDEMPPVPPEIRERYRLLATREAPEALHEELRRRDPVAASGLRPSDPQRIVRALELIEATGQPLAAIQAGRGAPTIDAGRATKIVLAPDRTWLRNRIAERFERMIEAGATGEVERFRALGIPAGMPVTKAIGLAELSLHLDGAIGLGEAIERAVTRSRQYAKRQETWFRHQLDATWERVEMGGCSVP